MRLPAHGGILDLGRRPALLAQELHDQDVLLQHHRPGDAHAVPAHAHQVVQLLLRPYVHDLARVLLAEAVLESVEERTC